MAVSQHVLDHGILLYNKAQLFSDHVQHWGLIGDVFQLCPTVPKRLFFLRAKREMLRKQRFQLLAVFRGSANKRPEKLPNNSCSNDANNSGDALSVPFALLS